MPLEPADKVLNDSMIALINRVEKLTDQEAETQASVKQEVAKALDAPTKSDVPAPLKWAGAIIAVLMTTGSAGLLFWMISSISGMQIMLARMDERQSMNAANWEAKFRSLDERLARLEAKQGHRP